MTIVHRFLARILRPIIIAVMKDEASRSIPMQRDRIASRDVSLRIGLDQRPT